MPRTLIATQTFRPPNLMINGAFDYWQRSTSATATTGEAYNTADRYMFRASGGGATYTASRSTDVPSSVFKYSASMVDPDATTDAICITQKIEAANIRPYIGKTVTFSCWVKNESTALTPQIRALVPVSGVEDSWSIDSLNVDTVVTQSNSFALTSGVWTRISHTFVVPASAAFGMSIYVFTNAVTGSPSLKTTGWMLNEGSSAPADFYRAGDNIQSELATCQRYCYSAQDPSITTPGVSAIFGVGQAVSTTSARCYVPFPVTMRKTPTLDSNTSAASGFIVTNSSGGSVAVTNLAISATGTGSNGTNMVATVAAGLTAGNASGLFKNSDANTKLVFDAEL